MYSIGRAFFNNAELAAQINMSVRLLQYLMSYFCCMLGTSKYVSNLTWNYVLPATFFLYFVDGSWDVDSQIYSLASNLYCELLCGWSFVIRVPILSHGFALTALVLRISLSYEVVLGIACLMLLRWYCTASSGSITLLKELELFEDVVSLDSRNFRYPSMND